MEIVSNVKVYGLDESVKASKYPMSTDISKLTSEITERTKSLGSVAGGTGHSQFLHGIIVQFDLNFTIKAWTEAERYHFLEFVSSQSTMHRITKFDLSQSYCEYVDPRVIAIMEEKIKDYNDIIEISNNPDFTEEERKDIIAFTKFKYLEILYTNPAGFQLTARMTTNYEQLKTIYNQRHNHTLPEWREFCSWILTLPHFTELCLKNK